MDAHGMMMRRTPMVSRQRGKTALVVLSATLGIGALVLLFGYLLYINSKEEDSLRQPLDLDAAAARSREREAKGQALEERRQNFERQARQRRLEQEREVQKKQ